MKNTQIKKIVFLTGTRADFGKIKSLISILQAKKEFEVHIFATGMHLNPKYGETVHEIEKCGFPNIHTFANQNDNPSLDLMLSRTIRGFGDFVRSVKPDLIVVHGDRTEALGGALVGAFNNILVAHIEGGELSGSIDEHMRHAITKLSHLHFVANRQAKRRLIQMGERKEAIFVIGSPDIDIMASAALPSWPDAKKYYDVPFDDFALCMFHPVTTELDDLIPNIRQLTDALRESNLNYVVVYPNSDPGTDVILDTYRKKFSNHSRFVVYPSLRFEYFLTMLKNARFVIGNSSAGIREAPYYGVPTIDIGSRQNRRWNAGSSKSIRHCGHGKDDILALIKKTNSSPVRHRPSRPFGNAGSDKKFLDVLRNSDIWKIERQKQFSDIDF